MDNVFIPFSSAGLPQGSKLSTYLTVSLNDYIHSVLLAPVKGLVSRHLPSEISNGSDTGYIFPTLNLFLVIACMA